MKFAWYIGVILSLFLFLGNKATINFDKTNLLQVHCNDDLKAYLLYVPSSSNYKFAWKNFHYAAFSLHQLLEKTVKEDVPVIIIIPETYQNSKTTDILAPLLEGARVALTWATVFRSLKNIDVRVVLISLDSEITQGSLAQVVTNVLVKDVHKIDVLSPTQFFKFQEVAYENKKSNVLITSIELKDSIENPHIISPNFPSYNYPAQRIVITGGAGFVGGHLAKALLEQGHQVIILDNLFCSTGDNIQDIKQYKNFEFYQIDVTKPFDIEGPIDCVIHLASVPSPYFYYKMPLETLSGIYGTKYTLELAVKKGARYCFSSTSEVYGDPEISPQVENYSGSVNPLGKRAPYDQSKRGSETLIKLYFERYGIDARIARIFNTYGPGMQLNDGRVVTNFIQAMIKNNPLIIYGDGSQTRSFCYISDMVQGLLDILQNEEIIRFKSIEDRIFNVGNPGEFTINEIAEKCNNLSEKYFNRKMNIQYVKNPDGDDPKIRKPDISYINKVTCFEPKICLDQGLEKMFLHFIKH